VIALKQRTAEEGVIHHAADPVRVYTEDSLQCERIRRSVEMAQTAIGSLRTELCPSFCYVEEIGCGTGDISGQLAWACGVFGYDCNDKSIEVAKRRFPLGKWAYCDINSLCPPREKLKDLLILCEVLEHIPDPESLVKLWLPHFRTVVISHPIDGDLKGDLSGGDHCWSYTIDDFYNWFKIGGHEVQSSLMFPLGGYNIALGWGRNLNL
jgi:SAM-dependent methyltransferase